MLLQQLVLLLRCLVDQLIVLVNAVLNVVQSPQEEVGLQHIQILFCFYVDGGLIFLISDLYPLHDCDSPSYLVLFHLQRLLVERHVVDLHVHLFDFPSIFVIFVFVLGTARDRLDQLGQLIGGLI